MVAFVEISQDNLSRLVLLFHNVVFQRGALLFKLPVSACSRRRIVQLESRLWHGRFWFHCFHRNIFERHLQRRRSGWCSFLHSGLHRTKHWECRLVVPVATKMSTLRARRHGWCTKEHRNASHVNSLWLKDRVSAASVSTWALEPKLEPKWLREL